MLVLLEHPHHVHPGNLVQRRLGVVGLFVKWHRLAFVDLHPGGGGYAEAIDLDALRLLARLALAVVRGCGCRKAGGCEHCVKIAECRSGSGGPGRTNALAPGGGADPVRAARSGSGRERRRGAVRGECVRQFCSDWAAREVSTRRPFFRRRAILYGT